MTNTLSLCQSCNCMTKTINEKCGKCEAMKSHITTEELKQIKDIVHQIYMDEDLMGGARKIKALINQALHQQREEIKKNCKNFRKVMPDIRHKYEVTTAQRIEHGIESYNQALDDVLTSLSSPKEESKEKEKPKSEFVTWRYPKKVTKTIHKDGISQIVEEK